MKETKISTVVEKTSTSAESAGVKRGCLCQAMLSCNINNLVCFCSADFPFSLSCLAYNSRYHEISCLAFGNRFLSSPI